MEKPLRWRLAVCTLATVLSSGAPAAASGSAPVDWGAFMVAWWNLDQDGTAIRPPETGGTCPRSQCNLTPSSAIPLDTSAGDFAEGNGANAFSAASLQSLSCKQFTTCEELNIPDGHDITWGGWARPTSTGSFYSIVSTAMSPNSKGGYYVQIAPDETLWCVIAENVGGTEHEHFAITSSTIPTNTLHHAACTYRDGAATLQAFVDGAASGASVPAHYTHAIEPPTFEISGHLSGFSFDGQIDEPFVFDGAMAAGDICRIRSIGIQGRRGWCDASDPQLYAACSTDADCNGRTGACDGGTGRCTGRLSSGPTGCRVTTDLPPCNSSQPTGALPAGQQTVRTELLLLKNPGPPTSRKIVYRAKMPGPNSNTLTGDPMAGGATLNIRVDSQEQCFNLPAVAWSPISTIGFRYADAQSVNGPVKAASVTMTPGGVLRMKFIIVATASPVNLVPPNPGTRADTNFAVSGGDQYCGSTAGVSFKPNSATILRARNSAAPASCNVTACP